MTSIKNSFPPISPPGVDLENSPVPLQDPATGESLTPDQISGWDAEHSWHPFTPMKHYLSADPLMVVEGKDVFLRDSHGKWYYDGCSSIWLNIHGHQNPKLNQAITDQLSKIAHCSLLGQANLPASVLAKRLIDVAPKGLNRVHFSDCGASAVEIAVKTSIQYWFNRGETEKRMIVGFKDNYHGDTLGAMAVAPSPLFHRPFLGMLPENFQLPYPVCPDQPWVSGDDVCDDQLGEPLRNFLKENSEKVAAVIVEPVEGAGGILPAPGGFLRLLRKICDEFQVHLIVDEVATGFGHTGHLFATTGEGVTPDILCLGKGLSGGYLPVSATLSTEEIYQEFLGEITERKTLYHGHSFAGNPLGCAVSIASLDMMPDVLETLPEKVQLIADELAVLKQCPCVLQVRQRGLMIGVTIADPSGNRFEQAAVEGYKVADIARENGIILRPIGDTVILMPPPCIEMPQLTDLMKRFVASLTEFSDSK